MSFPVISSRRAPRLEARVPGATRYPALGIAAVCVGTALAVWLVPADPEPKEALFYSALVMTMGLTAAPLAAGLRDPRSLLRGEHLLAAAPVYWLLLDPLQSAYAFDGVAPTQVRDALVGIGIFVIAVWLGALQRPWKAPATIVRAVSMEFSPDAYFRLAALAFFLGMLTFAIPCNFNVVEMFHYVGEGRWSAPWGRGQLGGWGAFQDHLQYFGYLLPVLTVIVARGAGWLNIRSLLALTMSVVMALFLAQGGGRRIIGVIFGMALILWTLTQPRVKTRHVGALALSGLVLLAAFELMLSYRNVGLGAAVEERGASVSDSSYLHVDDNLYRFCQIIELVPKSYPYVYHQYVIWILVRPIPRVLWPGKPVDPGFDLPSALGVPEGTTISCSVLGELYVSAGLLGIALGGWLYGRLAGVATRLLTEGATFGGYVIYGTLMMALFTGVRSMLELVLVSYVMLAWAGLARLAAHFGGRRLAPTRTKIA